MIPMGIGVLMKRQKLEGFLEKDADTFWTCEDEVNESWQSVRFKGRHTKKGKGKGRGKGRGKGHRFFKKRKGSGSFAHQAESTEETSQQALTDLVAKAVHEAMFGKGKGKRNKGKGKGKPNTSPDDLSTKGQGKPKGKGKGKGGKKGKAYEASGESSVPTASATEDWKEEEWDQSWEESGWDENSWYSGDWSTAVTPWSFYVESYECFASAVPGSYVYDLSKEATLCVLDLACTKGMTSRHAAQKLMQAIDAGKVAGVTYELAPTKSIFGFANGSSMELTEKIVLWFEQGPNFPYLHTAFDICEQGKTPFLMAINQMQNLNFDLKCRPTHIALSSGPLGLKDLVLPMTTTRHCALDFRTMAFRGASLASYKAGPVEKAIQGSHVFAGGPNEPSSSSSGPNSAVRANPADSSMSPGPLTANRESEAVEEGGLETFVRIDKNVRVMPTTCPDGPMWPTVVRRVVEDVDTGQVLSDEDVRGITIEELSGVFRSGPRNVKTTLYFKRAAEEPRDTTGAPSPPPTKPDEVTAKHRRRDVLSKLHSKLSRADELLRLHLKHHHMSVDQFKRRTSKLEIPTSIYELYDEVVNACPGSPLQDFRNSC